MYEMFRFQVNFVMKCKEMLLLREKIFVAQRNEVCDSLLSPACFPWKDGVLRDSQYSSGRMTD